MRASRRGPLHGLPDSNTRSLEGARLQPADLKRRVAWGGQFQWAGLVTFKWVLWSRSGRPRMRENRGAVARRDRCLSAQL